MGRLGQRQYILWRHFGLNDMNGRNNVSPAVSQILDTPLDFGSDIIW